MRDFSLQKEFSVLYAFNLETGYAVLPDLSCPSFLFYGKRTWEE
jgi:hypothetical protein